MKIHFRTFFSVCVLLPLLSIQALAKSGKKSDDSTSAMDGNLASILLKQLSEREQEAYDAYQRALTPEDISKIKSDLQSVVDGYDKLISMAPDYVPSYVAYGMLLHRIGESKASYAMFSKADELDPTLAIVKNQIGNYLAEEGLYAESLTYFMTAADLEPEEALYHYQIGNLLFGYRKFFVDDELFSEEAIDLKIQEYFQQAAIRAPFDMKYRLRFAQSFFDVKTPNWDAALEEWQQLIELAEEDGERQMMKLYMAKTRFEMGHYNAARKILVKLDYPLLEKSKQKLLDQINYEHPR